jgi:hypothetical protein
MKTSFGSQRFLAIYSGILTAAFVVTVLEGFASRKTTFAEVTVQRINVVEPDGTLRMVISDKALLPGIIIKGQEHPHPNRSTAGILFFNDEGTENGGLSFGGSKDKTGQGISSGHLSFDAYEQDQYFSIDAGQRGDKTSQSLTLVDRPDYPIGDLVAVTDRIRNLPAEQKKVEMAKFTDAHTPPRQRLYLGRSSDKSVALKLKDVDGHDRIVVQVAADGSPVIQFLDPKGTVISQLPAPPR